MAIRQNTLLIKRSNIIGKIPPISGLTLGEMALNTADAKLYTLFTSGTTGATEVRQIGWDRVSKTGDTISGDLIVNGNLTATTISATTFTFDTTYTGGTTYGSMNWDLDFGVPQVGMIGGNVVQKVGESVYAYVKNVDTTTLNKGEVVYLYGASGDKISVQRASNTGDTTSSKTLGVVAESIVVNGLGYVITQGTLDGLNLGTYNPGDTLWLSDIPGQFTTTKQYAPYHLVFIGVVQRANNGNGQMYVKPQNGYEFEELHNVAVTGATFGDLVTYSASNGNNLWVNTKTLPGSYTITGNTNVGGNLTVSGNTSLQGLTATTISATTYQNLPTDIRVTGATYNNNTFTYTNNTGGTFSVLFNTVTGLTVNGNIVVTGSTSTDSLILTSTPTSSYDSTQILMRNSTTGQIEITDSTSPSIYNYGMTYAIGSSNYLI